MPAFLDAYPELTLDMRLSDTQFDLIEGSIDLALRNSVPEDSSLKGRKLADDRRILCASPTYLETHGTPNTPNDLSGHRLIAFQDLRARPLEGPEGQVGQFDPASARGQLIIDDGLSQKIATLAGLGISLNARWSVQ
ncbi:substrate binding domain-containing protein [Ruegeria lacuscaerulensis]|uniref:substrate binding domain-containing protein n=1 Tax=Ruegeria lacuscaerulensis TaxID=55218 RepID=UPI0030136315